MTSKAICPVCQTERPVTQDGVMRRHVQVEDWPGVKVKRRCQGSGLPPLGTWGPPHKPHTEARK